jgi:hypothetical protein
MGLLSKVSGVVDKVAPMTGYGILDKALKNNSTSQSQEVMETPEQRAARQKLAQFMNTGQFGSFKAGEDIGLGYGDFNTTGIEDQGTSELQKLLSSGIPEQYQIGDAALKDLLNPDPNFIQSQFDPFKAQVDRQIKDSNTALKRNAGFAGNLYSTNTVKGLGDIQARGNETLTAQLASLTNDALNRRLQAIPLAYQSGTAQENINQGRISSAFNYGGLERTLNDARIKSADAEKLRKRNELLIPLNTAQSLASTNAQFGVPEVTVQNPNPYMDLLQSVISGGSKIMAAKAGG